VMIAQREWTCNRRVYRDHDGADDDGRRHGDCRHEQEL
jgi:hypothetical protein